MKIDEFWALIESANEQSQGDMDRKCELVQAAVSSLSPESAAQFSKHFDDAMNRAYSWDLWGAAYVINGGCGDDAFSDFRASLISMGKERFEKALENPDSLAQEAFEEDSWFYEGFQYAVHEGAEAAIEPQTLSVSALPDEPTGEPWEEEPGGLMAKYPQLWKKFEHLWAASDEPPAAETKPWWKFW